MITNRNLMLHGISEAILLLDTDGYIKYVNPAVAVVTGFTPAELGTKHLSFFL